MMGELEQLVYDTVVDSYRKITPGDVEKAVIRAAGVDKKTVKRAIKDLIRLGELRYTYLYGASYLERSFDRPIRVSRRIVIKPPEKLYRPEPGDVVIDISAGAAFGDGAHPSTLLALKALDTAMGDNLVVKSKPPLTGLDVGTGTGVLAIALARLGVDKVVGVDIDPCAVSEANNNVLLNGLTELITITNASIEDLTTSFSVIAANLAYPTLKRLSLLLSESLERYGVLVLSGFKETVSKSLGQAYKSHGLKLVDKDAERGWSCLVFHKTA